MLTYAEAERALAQMYKATGKAQAGAFRGRLKHLKRLGIPLGSNPGRGKKISYERNELWQWCFCLELSEFGIDPSLIARMVKKNWSKNFFPGFKGARNDREETYFCIVPEFMSASWSQPREVLGISGVGFIQLADLPRYLDAVNHARLRISLFSVTARIRELEKAFSAKEEQKP
jgi:hypothetical protein